MIGQTIIGCGFFFSSRLLCTSECHFLLGQTRATFLRLAFPVTKLYPTRRTDVAQLLGTTRPLFYVTRFAIFTLSLPTRWINSIPKQNGTLGNCTNRSANWEQLLRRISVNWARQKSIIAVKVSPEVEQEFVFYYVRVLGLFHTASRFTDRLNHVRGPTRNGKKSEMRLVSRHKFGSCDRQTAFAPRKKKRTSSIRRLWLLEYRRNLWTTFEILPNRSCREYSSIGMPKFNYQFLSSRLMVFRYEERFRFIFFAISVFT